MRFISKIQWKTAEALKRTTTTFQSQPWLEQSNKHSQIVFIDWSLFLIG
jgi:hypothetical protein